MNSLLTKEISLTLCFATLYRTQDTFRGKSGGNPALCRNGVLKKRFFLSKSDYPLSLNFPSRSKKMHPLFLCLSLFLSLFPILIVAEPVQEVTVTASRPDALLIDNSFASSRIITTDDIQLKQYRTVYEALKDVPGVDTFSSSPGQNATVFIRGQKSEQTLILIDGVEYNDPTDPGRSADLGVLQMDNVERIEVIRGAGSVLAPGTGSVINIITQSGKNYRSSLFLEGGSFGTIRSEAAIGGVTNSRLDYSMSIGAFRAEGISAAVNGTEKDGARNIHFSSRIQKEFADKTSAIFTARYFDAKTDLDTVPNDTPNNKASQQNLLSRLSVSHPYGVWRPTLGISLRLIDRESIDDGSTPNTKFTSTGDIEKIDWMNHFSLFPAHTLLFGILTERQHSSARSNFTGTLVSMDKAITQSTALLQYEYSKEEGLGGTAGARVDYHSSFLWQPTFRISPSYFFTRTATRLLATAGTGFKSPSLYQLYGEYGFSSLKPEKSFSADLGIEQSLANERSTVTLTGFYNKLTDMVDYNFTLNRYQNVGKAWTAGIEISQATRLWDFLRLTSAYTFLETKDEIIGLSLLRRPRHRVTNTLTYSHSDWDLNFTHLLVGERADIDTVSFARKTAPTYNLFHLSGSYRPWKTTQFSARIENLFDTKYQPIEGYGTPGISFYAGVKQEL